MGESRIVPGWKRCASRRSIRSNPGRKPAHLRGWFSTGHSKRRANCAAATRSELYRGRYLAVVESFDLSPPHERQQRFVIRVMHEDIFQAIAVGVGEHRA